MGRINSSGEFERVERVSERVGMEIRNVRDQYPSCHRLQLEPLDNAFTTIVYICRYNFDMFLET